MRIKNPIRGMTTLSILTFLISAVGLNIPWPPIVALITIPLLIGLPIELARHWDYLDAQVGHISNQNPRKTEEKKD